MQNGADQRIVVTGLGIVSAAGCDLDSVLATLRANCHCLQPITSFDTSGMIMTHAGEIPEFAPLSALSPVRARSVDRGSQLALAAAQQALAQAAGGCPLRPEYTGVAIGLSGALQFQNYAVPPQRNHLVNRRTALVMARSTPNFQADFLARSFSLGGPRFAYGAASVGSLLALAHAIDLLRLGHAEAMLVGGGEIQTLINALGMDSLGMGADRPCDPFQGGTGMSFGEGAAFVLLETLTRAEARMSHPLGEVLGYGVSADAYHDISNDPAGMGLVRSIDKALSHAGAAAADMAWVRGCGTGHRVQDIAEGLALNQCFDGTPPPVTSTEPYFGHVNGVAPLLGLVAGLAAQQAGIAPAMPITQNLRGVNELPLLQPGSLPVGDWLLTATAFGGNNGALVLGPLRARPLRSPVANMVGIAGMGAVSVFGCGIEDLRNGLYDPTRLAAGARRVDEAALPTALPGINLRRHERIARWALLAAAQALADAAVATRGSARVGLLLGLVRGPVTPYERFSRQLLQGEFNASTGRSMLKMSRFSVASELVHAFGLLGYCGTVCSGVHGGVQLLAHGAELLRASADLDALLVVAADEWTGLVESLYDRLGLLSASSSPYDPGALGTTAGEGAAALVLTRTQTGAGGWGRIVGSAFSGDTGVRPDPGGVAYARAVAGAIARAGLRPDQVDFAIGQGCGWAAHDARELAALARVRKDMPLSSILGQTGMVEGAGGLFGAIAAAAALRDGRLPPLPAQGCPQGPADFVRGVARHGDFRHALLLGSSERGAHAALLLQRAE